MLTSKSFAFSQKYCAPLRNTAFECKTLFCLKSIVLKKLSCAEVLYSPEKRCARSRFTRKTSTFSHKMTEFPAKLLCTSEKLSFHSQNFYILVITLAFASKTFSFSRKQSFPQVTLHLLANRLHSSRIATFGQAFVTKIMRYEKKKIQCEVS